MPKPLPLRRQIGFWLCFVASCLAFVYLVGVLPIQWILWNSAPPDWGTESEAIVFAERIVNDRLGRPLDEQPDWTPVATLRQPSPNGEKRLWDIVGTVAVDPETTRRVHVSACKEPDGRWALGALRFDDRIVFSDPKILEPPVDHAFYYDAFLTEPGLH